MTAGGTVHLSGARRKGHTEMFRMRRTGFLPYQAEAGTA